MAKFMRKDRKPPKEPIYDVESIASFSECTGLTPTPVEDEGEADAYASLYPIHRQQINPECKPRERG